MKITYPSFHCGVAVASRMNEFKITRLCFLGICHITSNFKRWKMTS